MRVRTFRYWQTLRVVAITLSVALLPTAFGPLNLDRNIHLVGACRSGGPRSEGPGYGRLSFQPGEIDVLTALDYRRWFAQMADMKIRVVRIYTLHPPAFYNELAAWNTDPCPDRATATPPHIRFQH